MNSELVSETTMPTAIVCVGMAGSGKTTFMQRINAHLHAKQDPPFIINLDPAVRHVPFECNIDIRDSVDYKEVMKSYNLGPNGGILTSLNLFATKIDQLIDILEKKSTHNPAISDSPKPLKNILVDTPGQIEVFVWSASGSILLDSLASSFSTVIAYIIDTPRTASTSTFMSNMLYACSILYKTKLPMILVFNKIDVKDSAFAKDWMTDFEAFQAALRDEEETGTSGAIGYGVGGGSGYMGSLLNSMSLMLEEFYNHLNVVEVSSMTGQGVDEFFEAVAVKAKEFNRDYKPELERRRKQRIDEKLAKREKDLANLMKDMEVSSETTSFGRKSCHSGPVVDMDTLSDQETDSDRDIHEEDIQGLQTRYRRALADSSGPG